MGVKKDVFLPNWAPDTVIQVDQFQRPGNQMFIAIYLFLSFSPHDSVAPVLVQPQPATKHHAAARSLPPCRDRGENWKSKSEKTRGSR